MVFAMNAGRDDYKYKQRLFNNDANEAKCTGS
jgi:hypothetical protein